MAWHPDQGGRQYRKEASAAKRGQLVRTALAGSDRARSTRKRPSCGSRKYGIEVRHRKRTGEWSEWGRWFGWHKTAEQRDQALAAFNKSRAPWGYEARPIDR